LVPLTFLIGIKISGSSIKILELMRDEKHYTLAYASRRLSLSCQASHQSTELKQASQFLLDGSACL
jgi:Tfp pilus assembly PilM family ATPase